MRVHGRVDAEMRLWSLHPEYLDTRGLVALWREGLLAQAVLRRRTKGYRHHPQLDRFGGAPSPVAAIAEYLRAVHAESVVRGAAAVHRPRPHPVFRIVAGSVELWERT